MKIHTLAAALGCLIILRLPNGAAAAPVTNVATPSGATHGGLVIGNIPCAIGANEIGDCGKSAPAGAIVGTSDAQTLANKSISGAQNALSNIPDPALSANVDLLNAAQSATGLKTFAGGLALPSGSNPSGSNEYLDSNGAFHIVNGTGDFQGFGAKFSGDSSRSWLTAPYGVGITESSSGQQPNDTCTRNDYFNGGSGLDFCNITTVNLGKGVNVRTMADAASGSVTLFVVGNANIASGQSVYGQCIPSGDTVSSYSSGTLNLTLATVCNIPSGGMVGIPNSNNSAPTNQTIAMQGQFNSFTSGNAPSGVAQAGYGFKYVPSGTITFGANFVCHDFTGRKSSIAGGGCLGTETDVEASGPDDNLSRFGGLITFAESGPSADGATTISYGLLMRPQVAGSQIGANPAEALIGYGASTMLTAAANGVYGSFGDAFDCDGGEQRGCFDVVSGTISFSTSALANGGQPNLVFPYLTNINVGQQISGSANIPAGTKVSAVYQCAPTLPLAGCNGATNETLVVLSANLTGSVASSTLLTFTGALPHGSYFNGLFTTDFANWTNQGGTGLLQFGSTNNTGTLLDIRGFGEDSINTTGVAYGDILFKETTNTHSAVVGEIDFNPAGSGTVVTNGAATVAGIFTTQGHVVSNGPAQSCSNIAFGTGAGTSPNCNSVTGDDHKFNINFTTGTSPGTSAAIWTLTVASYASAPNCVFSAVGGNTAASITKFLVSSTTTTVVLNVGSSALAASTAYNLNVQCTG